MEYAVPDMVFVALFSGVGSLVIYLLIEILYELKMANKYRRRSR